MLTALSIKHLTKPDLYEKDVKLLNPVRRLVNVFFVNTLVFKEMEEIYNICHNICPNKSPKNKVFMEPGCNYLHSFCFFYVCVSCLCVLTTYLVLCVRIKCDDVVCLKESNTSLAKYIGQMIVSKNMIIFLNFLCKY